MFLLFLVFSADDENGDCDDGESPQQADGTPTLVGPVIPGGVVVGPQGMIQQFGVHG